MKIYKNELSNEVKEIAESILFNGNGYIGVRNVFDEQEYDSYTSNRHLLLSGFFDTYTIKYPEDYFGSAKLGEQLIPVPEGLTSVIIIGDEEIDIEKQQISDHVRFLDTERGLSVRSFVVTDSDGNSTEIKFEKIVSFKYKEYFSTRIIFNKINHDLPIEVITKINLKPKMNNDKNDPRVGHNSFKIDINEINLVDNKIQFQAPNSGCRAFMQYSITDPYTQKNSQHQIIIRSVVHNNYYEKTFTYSLNEYVDPTITFEQLLESQIDYMKAFWDSSKINVTSEIDIEETINYGAFALHQSTSEHSIAAKGLSGLGYEGHVFWDAEMYVFPSLLYTQPKLAKAIVQFRINMIDKAIENRKNVGYNSGALFPWRTITGNECSSFFEAGMAQHHINLDITRAICMYFDATLDLELLLNDGWKTLIEVYKLFDEIIYKKAGEYHLDMVTGPDEYSALVNDNLYTNLMFKYLCEELLQIWNQYKSKLATTNYCLSNVDIEHIQDIIDCIHIGVNPELDIVEQDRDFLNKQLWPKEFDHKQPLLLGNHPLKIYRHQVSKQADAVLALQLFDAEFTTEQIQKSVLYYDNVTTHDSSLSYSNFATVYAKLKNSKAFEYFAKNARLDLDNLHHNTKDGIHTAAMGGTYQTLVEGFAGLQCKNGLINITNNLPAEIEKIEFKIVYRNDKYDIIIEKNSKPAIRKESKNV